MPICPMDVSVDAGGQQISPRRVFGEWRSAAGFVFFFSSLSLSFFFIYITYRVFCYNKSLSRDTDCVAYRPRSKKVSSRDARFPAAGVLKSVRFPLDVIPRPRWISKRLGARSPARHSSYLFTRLASDTPPRIFIAATWISRMPYPSRIKRHERRAYMFPNFPPARALPLDTSVFRAPWKKKRSETFLRKYFPRRVVWITHRYTNEDGARIRFPTKYRLSYFSYVLLLFFFLPVRFFAPSLFSWVTFRNFLSEESLTKTLQFMLRII